MNDSTIGALAEIVKEAISNAVRPLGNAIAELEAKNLSLESDMRKKVDLDIKALEGSITKSIADAHESVKAEVTRLVKSAIEEYAEENAAKAPEPKQLTVEEVKGAVKSYLEENPVKNGKDGLDAVQISIVDIVPSRKYAKGTYGTYAGGLLKANQDTDVFTDNPLEAGWSVVLNGIKAVELHQIEGGRFAVKTYLTDGTDSVNAINMPVMQYKGVWKDGQGNAVGDVVTYGGSMWHCNKSTKEKPGASSDWQLCVKRGQDGKDMNVVKTNKPEVYKI